MERRKIDDRSFESGFAHFIVSADLDSMLQPITSLLGGRASEQKAKPKSRRLVAARTFPTEDTQHELIPMHQ
jgi:hypothetical protein